MSARLLTLAIALLIATPVANAATYEVGTGKAYATPSAVPWESLQPGDLVLIYWQATPYKDKWVICRQGTAAAPIVVRGVAGPGGERPVIDGNGAVTRLALDYWGEQRAVIKIGGASIPADTMPKLHRRSRDSTSGARVRPTPSPTTAGNAASYVNNAAAVWIEKGEHIIVRNNVLHDAGNGLFVSSAEPNISRDILVEGNYIYDNGNVSSIYEHNTYTEALGITYQFNRFGPLRSGAGGNNLKDRSAGLVVRYNWIEGGNRQLDLVETDSLTIQNDPSYRADVRLRQRPDRAGGGGQPPDRSLRRRQRHDVAVPQGHAVLLPQHAGLDAYRPHDALPPVDQRRARRRAQQHLLSGGAHGPEPVAARRHRHPQPHAQLVQGRLRRRRSAACPAQSPTTAPRCWGTRRASSARRHRTSAWRRRRMR